LVQLLAGFDGIESIETHSLVAEKAFFLLPLVKLVLRRTDWV
jgi:hypothetical protein